MKKQLLITIPQLTQIKSDKLNSFQDITVQGYYKHNSVESVSSEEALSPSRLSKTSKLNVVQFEEFKIDRIQDNKSLVGNINNLSMAQSIEMVESRTKILKEPAAPKGSSKSKVFIFPELSENKSKQQQSQKVKIQNKEMTLEEQLQQYKKQLMYKDGQIWMLQKFISQHIDKSKQASYFKSLNNNNQVEKDKTISSLILKIQQLAQSLDNKNEVISLLKSQNFRLQSQNYSLQNKFYIISMKQSVFTQQNNIFNYTNHQQSKKQLVGRYSLKMDHLQNVKQLQKRLHNLKANNLQLQISKKNNKNMNNNRNKQLFWTSVTSTNKAAKSIDFKQEEERSKYS